MAEKIAVGILLALLRQFGALEEDIPTMLAIAQMESGLTDNIEGKVNDNGTRDVGIWQINAESYWEDTEGTNDNKLGPDKFTKRWMIKNGGELSIEEFRERALNDVQYSTKFSVDLVKERRDNPISYESDDPFTAWTVYTKYIKPYLEDGTTKVSGGIQKDMDIAVSYIEKFDSIEDGKYNPSQDKDVDYFENSLVDSVPQPQPQPEPDIGEPEVEDTGEVIEVDSTPKHIDDRPEEVEQPIKLKSSVFLRNLDKVTRFNEPDYIKENYGVETPVQQVQKFSLSIEDAYQKYIDAINK